MNFWYKILGYQYLSVIHIRNLGIIMHEIVNSVVQNHLAKYCTDTDILIFFSREEQTMEFKTIIMMVGNLF